MTDLPLNIRDLQTRCAQGERFKYVYFWGHTAKQGVLGKECFSQWYSARFTLDDVAYKSAEHYMMAQKARLFDDDEMLQKILESKSPAEAKAFGRKVRGFSQEAWKAHREDIVTQASVAKFSQNKALGDYLKGTKNRVLVEAAPRDRIWGVGLGQERAAEGPQGWRGLNLLGFCLMRARELIS